MSLKERRILKLYSNDVVRWEHDGKQYCLHIRTDEFPENPREWHNVAIMACWHGRYNLGDEIAEKEPEDFWRRLVKENVPESEVYASAEAGRLHGIEICKNGDDAELIDIYSTYLHDAKDGVGLRKDLEYDKLRKEDVVECLIDIIEVKNCMTLLEPYAEWLPLWLYDHGGITISCGSRTGQYADRWDSGAVGWIVMLKKTIMDEVGTEYVLDDAGEMIRVEHKHPDAPSTWSYLTKPLTDETWRKWAIEIMEAEVEIYDQYLTGDAYGFNLYSAELVEEEKEPEWNEEESCWGFFGSDMMENGIVDEVGNGFREMVETGNYEQGRAVEHSCFRFSF